MRSEVIGSCGISSTTSHVHIGQRIVLNLHLIYIKAQTKGKLPVVAQQDVTLVESCKVPSWSFVLTRYSHLGTHVYSHLFYSSLCSSPSSLSTHSLPHKATNHSLKHRVLHGIGNRIADRTCDAIAKEHGCIGVKPLVRSEQTCSMLPTTWEYLTNQTLVVATQHKLLSDGIHLLSLIQLQIIACHIVLVHQHQVVQVLIAGG